MIVKEGILLQKTRASHYRIPDSGGSVVLNLLLIVLVQTAQAATYRQGFTGQTVTTIQTKLKRWGYYSGEVDGVYGSATVEAVKYFQRTNGLTADGVAGPATLQALGIYETDSSGSGGATSEQWASLDCWPGSSRRRPG